LRAALDKVGEVCAKAGAPERLGGVPCNGLRGPAAEMQDQASAWLGCWLQSEW